MLEQIKNKISEVHGSDEKQLDIIFSDADRIIVEAPAGCGKTTTLVSKIAYMIATRSFAQNKKVLALTFSVNAAYKMKKDLADKLPEMGLSDIREPADLNRRMFISNYHGLCRRILSLYGYLINPALKEINMFKAIGETDAKFDEFLDREEIDLSEAQVDVVKRFGQAVSECDEEALKNSLNQYNEILISKFIEKKSITYNGYISLTMYLLEKNKELLNFYQKLFPVVVIDEFQDTNYLSWCFVKSFINDDTKLFFVGDPLQRIYGFIGAVPKLMNVAADELDMVQMRLEKNYRFKDNLSMLSLDRNIRSNALNCKSPVICSDAIVNLHISDSHEKECEWIADNVASLLKNDSKQKTSILVQQRGVGIDMIMKEFDQRDISYFYALFTDDDEIYVAYHFNALEVFRKQIDRSRYHRVSKSVLNRTLSEIGSLYKGSSSKVVASLIDLTQAFFEKIIGEYAFLSDDEKYTFICDTFENRALKQNMDAIDARVFVSTVHGAKGLEWENVIIPDMEPYCFPNCYSLCGNCDFNTGRFSSGNYCRINIHNHDIDEFLEELSVFYVAVTRARKNLFFSASKSRYNNEGERKSSKISCLLTLPGIKPCLV